MTKRKKKLPPLKLASDETFGERLSRLRKERGLTQVELAEQVGIIQSIMTDYERGKLRLNAEMICRFARVLAVSTDELLGMKRAMPAAAVVSHDKLPLRLIRRIQKIERLPTVKQKALLQTIDGFLRGEGVAG